MKKLKWLIEIADKRPLLFSILLLIIAIGYLTDIAIHRDRDINRCSEINNKLRDDFAKQLEQKEREKQLLNDEVKETLNTILTDYKIRLEEQYLLNHKIDSTINENKRLLMKINNTKPRK